MKIELRKVFKQYGSVHALDDVSLSIEPGQIVALVGTNGAGKTTLMRCLAGIVAPTSGQLLYDGEHLLRDRLELRRRLFFLPDFPAVFEEWHPLQHIGMVLRLYGRDAPGVEESVVDVLRDLDLLPVASSPFAVLSRGQRYKAALAALFAVDPELWLLDEPFASGMDPNGINAFKQRTRTAAAAGRTVIYSTQILDAAERFSDRVCVVHRGRIRAFSVTAELRSGSEGEANPLDDLFTQLREEESP
jgi:ABC-type multidrug transport system ATPase subunit